MSKPSGTSYVDESFNPLRGCNQTSPGCDNCTAMAIASKAPNVLGGWGNGKDATRILTGESNWNEPLKWDAQAAANGVPMRVLVMSLGDVFEPWQGPITDTKGEQVFKNAVGGWLTRKTGLGSDARNWDALTKDDVLERWLGLVVRTPNLQWLVVTKFPEYITAALARVARLGRSNDAMRGAVVAARWVQGFAPRNVWLGVSAETHALASQRLFYLRQTEARVRFLAAQPMLERFRKGWWFDKLKFDSDTINWLVIGGETGPNARKFDVRWGIELLTDADEFGIPVWVDGVGANAVEEAEHPTSRVRLQTTDVLGQVPSDWPLEMRLRELPDLEGM